MQRTKLVALAISVMIIMTACSGLPLIQTQSEHEVALPTPPLEAANVALVGDGRTAYQVRVTLMYPSLDMQQLTGVPRMFEVESTQELIEQVMTFMLQTPKRDDVLPITPSGTKLVATELVNGIATIDLSPEARAQSLKHQAYMRLAIANTLTSIQAVRGVNILIGGQVESVSDAIVSVPNGVMLGMSDSDLPAIWAQLQSDSERFSNNNYMLNAHAVVYSASTQDDRLVPELRQIRFRSDDLVMPVLRALLSGDESNNAVRGVLPSDMEPLMSQPTITTSADGQRLITLLFLDGFEQEMIARGYTMRQVYGALTLSLTRFVPEVDGLRVRVGNMLVESIVSDSGEIKLDNGVMRAADFTSLISDTVNIYLGNEDGTLSGVRRVIDTYAAQWPRLMIDSIIAGPLTSEIGLERVVPSGITSADVLGVRLDGDTVRVNLSSNFYRCCQSLSDDEERLLVYALVNTLTELDGLAKVRFYVEGETVDSLAGEIYLNAALIRNPGIIRG